MIGSSGIVEESNLTENIETLRKVLSKGDDKGAYIQTIPDRGYRFTAEVSEYRGEAVVAPTGRSQTDGFDRGIGKRRKLIGDLVIFLVVVATAYLLWASLR